MAAVSVGHGVDQRILKRYALLATLATALLLRLPGIGWGLPPDSPNVRASDLRSSYAFDEDDILSGAAKASVAHFDFDPHEYHWGTLHVELVLLALDGAQAAHFFRVPWRVAYYNLVGQDFVRVYVVGRFMAVAMALLTVWLLFRFPSEWAGPFAAMLVAVSPSHMLQSDQVRVDVTMTALLTLTLLEAIRGNLDRRPARQFWVLGMAAGLAIAAKYSAVTAVAAIALVALLVNRFPMRGLVATAAGVALGFVLGGPYVVIKPRAFYDQISRYMIPNAPIPPGFAIAPARLLELHAANIVRFSMGLPASLLAVAGLIWMMRRRAGTDWLIFAGIVGYVAILFPLSWPLIRYDLPLTIFFGLCAGMALERLPPRWRYGLTGVALIMPCAGCIAQIHYMRAPHPANLMLQHILRIVPPGATISRLVPEAPPLDRRVYPLGPDLFLDNLASNPPPWVLTSDLPDQPYRASTLALLHSGYQEVARVEGRRVLAWATLGEEAAPHDWKYTHMSFTLYRKKPQ